MSTRARTLRGRAVRLVLTAVVGALALTGCDFSVYSLPLPGGADLGDNPYKVTIEFRDVLDLVPQSAVKVDDVTVGRVDRIETQGYHAEVTVLVRGERQAARRRRRHHPADQPAGREVRVPGAAALRQHQRRPVVRRRPDPARPQRPQPRGRGGAGRTVAAAQRWRRRTAQDHLGRAQLRARGPRGQRALGARPARHVHGRSSTRTRTRSSGRSRASTGSRSR